MLDKKALHQTSCGELWEELPFPHFAVEIEGRDRAETAPGSIACMDQLTVSRVVATLATCIEHKVRGARSKIDASAYYAVKPLSKSEQAFFRLLDSSLPGCVILAQVDLKRIVRTKKRKSRKNVN
ncbi:hypothetical protein [Pandoraea apista]|uniref:Uncharacterized protein n=1 Tax=Pandoraea apista TaxID=93218 RepID=A0ABX9ZUH6_9BURK|nr:hypothetical protein [Pandoraea apista]RRJ33244.1 hypothetical protein EIB05_07035 [Pandoraea apista]RRJ80379.1 hypothetical protein EIL82_09560 [Pandoraea apista]RSD15087.1 hypothetical protein EJB12_08515 [Pandoraea apista]RSD16034.1 hypothetical protein EIZ52_15895 [Pandoraea apista]RSK85397.1 hypothetical protein EJE96_06725 [Pandoraea apista]